MSATTYVKAINGALHAAMRDDDRVIVIGEDVAEGGPFTATAGLADAFGRASPFLPAELVEELVYA